MNKKLINNCLAVFAGVLVLTNLTVVVDGNKKPSLKFQTLGAYAQTSSSSSSSSSSSNSSTSSETSSSTNPSTGTSVPASWGSSNPWGTGQNYYDVALTITAGTVYYDESTDGGASWKFDLKLFGQGASVSAPVRNGTKLTRTITITSAVTGLKACEAGGTGRCDYKPIGSYIVGSGS
ncbi:hypothetical protein [Sphingobacterium sp. MYb388]|uniref:hypothetical protein n=1 Tax=Sphingobacterium sp. MYb388 TaxID=2745437 RepID=UPI0030A0D6E8